MDRSSKSRLLLSMAVGALVVFGAFVFFGCSSLWAKDFPVDPGANAYLAKLSGLSVEGAALEAIRWNVPNYDHVPRDRISTSVDEQTPATFVVRITYSAQDDSYHAMFYEVSVARRGAHWVVTRMRGCWTGRSLTGWSTDVPS